MKMKTRVKYIALSAAVALMAACSPEYNTPDQTKLPLAADFDVKVDVDQETNYVTFNMNNQAVVPVWIVGATDPIDNASGSKVTGKNYAYTGNGLQLRFRDAGEHSVEVKAYNSNGLSVGSKIVKFSLDNTYRDPFDASPYIKALSNGSSQTWEWNYTVAGHFGCGPIGGTGTEWWSAGANEKEGMSLYDDKITFTSEGKYTFDPGDGQTFVNVGSGVKPEYNTTGQDYIVPWDVTETTYAVENSWNDAGVEEIYITLPKGTPMSYIADQTGLDDPRYLVLESKPADMKKCLKLVANLKTSANPDGIAWHYEFVKEGSASGGGAEDPLYGKESKTWVLASDMQGHLGCGENQSNPAGWWSANPNDKAGTALYDDEITFYADGKYVFNPGADGKIYINYGVTATGLSGQSADYDYEWSVQESTYKLEGDVLTFPKGIVIGYLPGDEVYNNPTYVITENTEDKLVIVANLTGISWQYIYKPKPATSFDIDGEGNLWKKANVTMSYWYSASDWSGALTPETEVLEGNGLKVVIPEGIGGSEWQGQTVFHSDVPMSASKTYDFCATVESDQDISAMTFKLAWEGNDQDHAAFYVNNFSVEAGEAATFKMEAAAPDVDYDKAVLFVDLGRCAAGSTVTLSKICLQEHK